MKPVFQLSMEELERVIQLVRGIAPDVDIKPMKAKHKIDQLAQYFEAHRDLLRQLEGGGKK